MLQVVEIQKLLKVMGFVLENGTAATWIKSFKNHGNYSIRVNFVDKNINYGSNITIGDKTTSNFKSDENFVVLECVNRLLEKGFKPESLYLEKRWATGHGTSGKLDILVMRENKDAYMMIECKTFGEEFTKELKNIKKNGGQIFTYFQQDKKAEVLALYASHLSPEGKLEYCNEIIKIEDDYRQTSSVKDFYDRWNKLTKNNGVFDQWVQAYDFQSKALTLSSLKEITQTDSSFIFNQFLEILRHNVVSDKPNAFNKIFTLFLCKICDEKGAKRNDELAFQWFHTPYTYEGISYPPDDNISFQKRLTDLYKKGMREFLDKNVTDISDAEFEQKYGSIDKETKQQILNDIIEIRLKKNNEFAIKEVFDDESFEDNAKVVREVVELLQGFKIRYTKKQQYLSDFFEMLLTTGLKQESGQFFTPVPIAQFIIKSLPLDKLVKDKLEKGEKDNYLPTVIDYAAGSGHFITESMHEIQNLINKADPEAYIPDTTKKLKSWQADHFEWAHKYVYGIEKDYRLVKVGKVGCYLHGDGLAQIIHSDGLGNFSNTSEYKGLLKKTNKDDKRENKQFDIVISNPPYSVSAFKNNARKYYDEGDFELYKNLTDQSGEIECLFIERTKQLLKDGGLAGIILPSSILSNTGIYTKARELILKYFEIVGIAELGSNTFMATGTNTVTLFLRRRNNYTFGNVVSQVQKTFDAQKDLTIHSVQKPIEKYVEAVWEGLSIEDYWTLLVEDPNQAVQKHENFESYKSKVKPKEAENFLSIVISREIEKVAYFILSWGQQVVVVKSGEKKKEKEFLGYEFSNRRGNEGIHPIQRSKSIEECTKLFDPDRFDNPKKASTYIYQAFSGKLDSQIDESLKENIFRHDLVEMLTFDHGSFEKTISITAKKKLKFKSKWPLTKLSELISLEYGKSLPEKNRVKGQYPVMGSNGIVGWHNEFLLEGPSIIIGRKGSVGRVTVTKENCSPIDTTLYVQLRSPSIQFGYCAAIFKHIENELIGLNSGMGPGGLNRNQVYEIKIPMPAVEVQKKIASEIQSIEHEEQKTLNKLEGLKVDIANRFANLEFEQSTLGEFTSFKNGLNYSRKSSGDLITIVGVKDFRDRFSPDLKELEKVQIDGKISEGYRLKPNDILVVRSNGSVKLVGRFLHIEEVNTDTSFSGFTIRIRPDQERVNSKFLCYYLKTSTVRNKLIKDSSGSNIKSLNQGLLSSIKIPLPPLKEQKSLVDQIEKVEVQIKKLKQELVSLLVQKDAVLEKHF